MQKTIIINGNRVRANVPDDWLEPAKGDVESKPKPILERSRGETDSASPAQSLDKWEKQHCKIRRLNP